MAVQYVGPILLLMASNLFMTVAWYGHLKFTSWPLWIVVLGSWGIALFEYILQVPANRLGSQVFSVTQLKVMQEAITLIVFVGFAWVYFKEVPNWRTGLAVLLVITAVAIVPRKGEDKPEETRRENISSNE
ncbi:MAG: DMT family protein [Fimbriiglobus sp.]|nr:DMT family protein [Fimbriiglobus sp.]